MDGRFTRGVIYSLTAMAIGLLSDTRALAGTELVTQFVSAANVPRGVVASLAQDASGLLWIGTGDGLARFDGYRLRPVERDAPTATERNLGWVRALATAGDGRVWIGTETDGVALYDPSTDRVRLLSRRAAHSPPLPTVHALQPDATGALWVGSLGGGLQRVSPDGSRTDALTVRSGAGPEDRVLALAIDSQGSLWVGHWRGLSRVAAHGRDASAQVVGSDFGTVQALVVDDRKRLWLGTQDGRVGWLDTTRRAPELHWISLPEAGAAVNALALDAEGSLWVGRSSGLDRIDTQTLQPVAQVRPNPSQPGTLAGAEVTTLLRDRTGHLWVGGFGLGLQRLARHPALSVIGPARAGAGPLGDGDVRSLLALADGRLLAGTRAGPIAVFDRQLQLQGLWRRPPGEQWPVDAMAQSADGALWLAGAGRIQQLDGSGRRIRVWPLHGGQVLRLVPHGDGDMLIATRVGLFRLHPTMPRPQKIAHSGGEDAVAAHFALQADGHGGLWVGTSQGLFRLPANRTELEPVAFAPGAGLGSPVVVGLLRGRDGTLWLDTAVAGLHRLNDSDASGRLRLERVSERHGRVGRPFGANLHEDEAGRIWSQNFVYDPAQDRLDEITAADGAQIGTAWFFVDAKLPDGRLVFGGSRGLLVAEPDRFRISNDSPPVVLTHLRVNGVAVQPGRWRDGLALPAGTRSFGVEFAALDYSDPERLRYRHRLEGFEDEWITSDASFRNPSYSQLTPGRYTLRVQASNRHGIWSRHELAVPIEVQPAWWQHHGVRAGAGLVAIIGLLGVVQWRMAWLKTQQRTLQALVDARTAELQQATLALQRESEALQQASVTDPLTGLFNRRYVSLRIDEDLAVTQRRAQTAIDRGQVLHDGDVLIVLIDIDHFKRINDEHGHAAGDAVLVEAAARLRPLLRDSDSLVRWGGEEFLVIARASDRSQLGELCERLRRAFVAQPFVIGGEVSLPVTASCGACAYPPTPERPSAWDWSCALALADAALYTAKALGRNAWVAATAVPAPARDTAQAHDAQRALGDARSVVVRSR